MRTTPGPLPESARATAHLATVQNAAADSARTFPDNADPSSDDHAATRGRSCRKTHDQGPRQGGALGRRWPGVSAGLSVGDARPAHAGPQRWARRSSWFTRHAAAGHGIGSVLQCAGPGRSWMTGIFRRHRDGDGRFKTVQDAESNVASCISGTCGRPRTPRPACRMPGHRRDLRKARSGPRPPLAVAASHASRTAGARASGSRSQHRLLILPGWPWKVHDLILPAAQPVASVLRQGGRIGRSLR